LPKEAARRKSQARVDADEAIGATGVFRRVE
jgi:hypothetical protein